MGLTKDQQAALERCLDGENEEKKAPFYADIDYFVIHM